MTSSTETQDEQHPRRDKASRGQISKGSSSSIFPDQEMGDGGLMTPPIVSEQPPPIRCPAPFETEDLALDRTMVPSSFEERTEYYDHRTCCMYHRILNYRIRRDTGTTRTTKHSSTSSPRRNNDLQIEENQDMRQRSMLAAAIDQDTCLQCMEEIFDLEM